MARTVTHSKPLLPHWHPPGQDIFITWRLTGSLPAQLRPPEIKTSAGKVFRSYDHFLDQALTGPLWLRNPLVAGCIVVALESAHRRHLIQLCAYVLMANHVHVLLNPHAPIARITQAIKRATSRKANLILGRVAGPFWQDESFDHWVRDPAEFNRIRSYIERNPVSAGLVQHPQDWPWSSASRSIE